MAKQKLKLEQKVSTSSTNFPFAAIVGQEEIKLGLILNVIDPSIGGVLMMGHRGTGKSTAVRALADLLPQIRVSRGCHFNCDPAESLNLCSRCKTELNDNGKLSADRSSVPVVDLPLGATEDRICGSIDIQRALGEGVKAFEPGLLARANRGFLYIDEVNLLEDHLVDLLLDVAVTGRNQVERENISVEHPARFVLIGSGNPEEGELRPQLLDRFGLYVEVKTENDPEMRVEIISRREAFDREQKSFSDSFAKDQQSLQQRIARARKAFARVKISRELLHQIASLCSELKVDGHRGELTIMRAARALAAFAGRKAVTANDVRRVTIMSLRHRLHRDPLSDNGNEARIEKALDQIFPSPSDRSSKSQPDTKTSGQGGNSPGQPRSAPNGNGSHSETQIQLAEVSASPATVPLEKQRKSKHSQRSHRAKGSASSSNWQSGRYVQATTQRKGVARIAIDATLRALLATGIQAVVNGSSLAANLRFKRFARKEGTLFIFAIDTSGSMARARIQKARVTILNLLQQSYINRDSVAVIAFRGVSAELLLPPTRSILRARKLLESLSVGGGTPLSAGLSAAIALTERATIQQHGKSVLLLFTDGGANVPLQSGFSGDRNLRQETIANEVSVLGAKLRSRGVETVVVETNENFATTEQVKALAARLRAKHLQLDTLANRS
ncbi:MAG TPA: magnesium chelatase ATPase subunit I [Pyrinomonadaceae bacterium]|nr:magnesium chelatase ATPase subunit I [Pyrinomonadaceae bacterium]